MPGTVVLPVAGNHEWYDPDPPDVSCAFRHDGRNACGFEAYFGDQAFARHDGGRRRQRRADLRRAGGPSAGRDHDRCGRVRARSAPCAVPTVAPRGSSRSALADPRVEPAPVPARSWRGIRPAGPTSATAASATWIRSGRHCSARPPRSDPISCSTGMITSMSGWRRSVPAVSRTRAGSPRSSRVRADARSRVSVHRRSSDPRRLHRSAALRRAADRVPGARRRPRDLVPHGIG